MPAVTIQPAVIVLCLQLSVHVTARGTFQRGQFGSFLNIFANNLFDAVTV